MVSQYSFSCISWSFLHILKGAYTYTYRCLYTMYVNCLFMFFDHLSVKKTFASEYLRVIYVLGIFIYPLSSIYVANVFSRFFNYHLILFMIVLASI